MAKGDFLILRNEALVTTLPNTGTNLDALWDTQVYDEGSAVTYSSGTFTFTNTAPYLIMYSERFNTANTTNNERIEGNGRIAINGTALTEGAGEGYIRKSSGDQDMIINGTAIYNATAGDEMMIDFYRGDNSTTGTVERVPGFGGVQILELDSADAFARYSTTADNTISSTEADVTNWTTDQEVTTFVRSTNSVSITTAGRYLMTFAGETSETGTSRLGATVFLERLGTEITGVRGYSHMRGLDGNVNGALSFSAIVDVSGGDVFTLRSDADTGSMVLNSGAKWQWWRLPTGNETAIMEATTGEMNPAVTTDFVWDTLPHIDTASFTATAGTANIDVNQGCHALAFWNQGKKVMGTSLRTAPMGQIAVNGVTVNYAASSSYHRATAGIGTFMAHGGAVILPSLSYDSSITLENTAIGASGNISVESGHFSMVNLEGLYKNYDYNFPINVNDVDGDEVITNSQTNIVITGEGFKDIQGIGKVELVQNFDYTGTIIEQTNIGQWADGTIIFDVSPGLLSNTICYLFVTTSTGSSDYIQIQVGLPPGTYQEAVEGLLLIPDHYWRFQNNYDDEIGTATANKTTGGSPGFATTPLLVKDDTHSLLISSTTDYISPADQSDMNITISANRRYIGGWIQLDSISQNLAVIWEEGAKVNNFAFLNGFGNNLIFQCADAGGDYMQAYFDVPLTPNRPYHIIGMFNSSAQSGGICGAFLDGVLQTRTDGNPWEVSTFPTHSGNISWGHEGTEDLKVGDDRGVDATIIEFTSPVSCNYAHWYSWSDISLAVDSDIRATLFEKGAVSEISIIGDTQVFMQANIDSYSDTLFTDWPCSIEIGICTDGDFELTLDNITFEDKVSMQIRYMGIDTLTLVVENGSSLNTNKLGVPYGGNIEIIDSVPVTIIIKDAVDSSVIQNARVYITTTFGGDLASGITIIEGLTDINGEITSNLRYTNDQPFFGRVRRATTGKKYKTSSIIGTITATGFEGTTLLISDE